MIYRPSTTRRAPREKLDADALEYLKAALGLDLWVALRHGPATHAADTLYELVGPDPKRLGVALAVLDRLEKLKASIGDPNSHLSVVGGKYIGEVEAESAEQALELAWDLDGCCVSLCHQCTDQCEDPTIEDLDVYNVDNESDRATTRAAPEDRGRKEAAFALLELVEEATATDYDVLCEAGVHGYRGQIQVSIVGPGDSFGEPTASLWALPDELGDACRRLLAQLKDGGA